MKLVEHVARVICRRTCPNEGSCVCDEFSEYEDEATDCIKAVLKWVGEACPRDPA